MTQTAKKSPFSMNVDLMYGPIFKNLLLFMLPIFISSLFQQLYNTVDTMIVGNVLGDTALAAIGSCGSIYELLVGFGLGIGNGLAIVAARSYGAQDHDLLKKTVAGSLVIGLVASLCITLAGVLGLHPLLLMLDTPAEILDDAYRYILTIDLGVLVMFAYNLCAGLLRAIGNSVMPLVFLLISSALNVGLDLLFIMVFRWGVAGAAIATDISQLVSCVLSLRFLMRVEDDYRVTAKEVRVHKKMAVRIIKVGLPTGIQNMVISLSNVLVQVSVNGYGAAAMAGFAAYMKVDGFNILPVLSFSMAATTFVGQNFGAGKIDRVKKGTFVTLGMCIVYTILTGILLLVFQDSIMHLFTGDETVIAYGKICMLYFCPFYWMLGILQGLAGTVRGTGKSVPPMVVLLISLCLFRIVWIQFVLPLFAGIEGVLLVYPVSWAVGAVLMVLYAWKGKWMQLPEAIS